MQVLSSCMIGQKKAKVVSTHVKLSSVHLMTNLYSFYTLKNKMNFNSCNNKKQHKKALLAPYTGINEIFDKKIIGDWFLRKSLTTIFFLTITNKP